MKILLLANNPNRAGFRQRFNVYFDIMKSYGIEPVVESPDKSFLKRIMQYRQMDRYDAILLHKKCLNFMEALFFCPQKAKVIFSYDDAIMFNDKGQSTWTHLSRFRRSLKKADNVIVGSSYLAQQAEAYHKSVNVLPLGLKINDYSPDVPKPGDGKIRLVWIGSTATLGYIEELKPVIQKLARQYPNLVLRLICDDFIDIPGVTIEKVRWQVETRGRNIAECDIGLAPLPDTPFTRGKCSFKVLEYSASGLPVAASPVGTNADYVQEGQTGFLTVSEEQWFEKLSLLIETPSLGKEMGQKGRQFAAQFDISLIGQKLCEIIIKTASKTSDVLLT
jgi:glycosyltransferase involved in cell wall biosynthesis